jgi:predicted PhzF superfamily epimerase YddE/YHI9
LTVHVVSVFVAPGGEHGNPLGVVFDAAHVPARRRQQIAAALGFSETVFVDDRATGAITIHTPVDELPFAGHPTVGTAWLLADEGTPVDALHPPAGEVPTWADGDLRWVRAQPEWAPEMTFRHYPEPATVDELTGPPEDVDTLYAWAWMDEPSGTIRARMFAPALGILEDEATGSAAVRLTAKLGRPLTIVQGQGSWMHTTLAPDDMVDLGGRVVRTGAVPLPH